MVPSMADQLLLPIESLPSSKERCEKCHSRPSRASKERIPQRLEVHSSCYLLDLRIEFSQYRDRVPDFIDDLGSHISYCSKA